MDKLPQSRLSLTSGKKLEKQTSPEAAANITESTDRHSEATSRSEYPRDKDRKVGFELDDEIEEDGLGEEEELENSVHLRGGAGRGTHYTSQRTTTVKTARRGHKGSTGSRSSSGTYVSYSSGGSEKKFRKPVSESPRFRILCCACMWSRLNGVGRSVWWCVFGFCCKFFA